MDPHKNTDNNSKSDIADKFAVLCTADNEPSSFENIMLSCSPKSPKINSDKEKTRTIYSSPIFSSQLNTKKNKKRVEPPGDTDEDKEIIESLLAAHCTVTKESAEEACELFPVKTIDEEREVAEENEEDQEIIDSLIRAHKNTSGSYYVIDTTVTETCEVLPLAKTLTNIPDRDIDRYSPMQVTTDELKENSEAKIYSPTTDDGASAGGKREPRKVPRETETSNIKDPFVAKQIIEQELSEHFRAKRSSLTLDDTEFKHFRPLSGSIGSLKFSSPFPMLRDVPSASTGYIPIRRLLKTDSRVRSDSESSSYYDAIDSFNEEKNGAACITSSDDFPPKIWTIEDNDSLDKSDSEIKKDSIFRNITRIFNSKK